MIFEYALIKVLRQTLLPHHAEKKQIASLSRNFLIFFYFQTKYLLMTLKSLFMISNLKARIFYSILVLTKLVKNKISFEK